jgi:hypothetical protein
LSTTDYTIKKIKRFIPEIIIVLPLALYNIYERKPLSVILSHFTDYLSEGFGFGWLYFNAANASVWYISVFIWGGALIYSFMYHYRKITIHIIIPFICIIGFGLMHTGIEYKFSGIKYGFSLPLLRGIVEMCFGVFFAYVLTKKYNSLINYKKYINIGSIIGLVAFLSFAIFYPMKYANVMFFLSLFMLGLFIEDSWLQKIFNNKIWTYFGRISLEILIVNFPIIDIYHHHTANSTISPLIRTIILFSIILISSYLLQLFTEYLRKHIRIIQIN